MTREKVDEWPGMEKTRSAARARLPPRAKCNDVVA
jgi:hypothetical protein